MLGSPRLSNILFENFKPGIIKGSLILLGLGVFGFFLGMFVHPLVYLMYWMLYLYLLFISAVEVLFFNIPRLLTLKIWKK